MGLFRILAFGARSRIAAPPAPPAPLAPPAPPAPPPPTYEPAWDLAVRLLGDTILKSQCPSIFSAKTSMAKVSAQVILVLKPLWSFDC